MTNTVQALRFRVIGDPMTQGSKSPVLTNGGRLRVLEGKNDKSRERHRSWRDSVAWEASRQVGRNGGCFPDGPLECTIWFRLPMPQSRSKRDRLRGWLWAWRKLDVDKLQRSTFDSLKDGGLIIDDSRIVLVVAGKVEVPAPEWTGAVITLAPADLDMMNRPWEIGDAA